jgi:hypothetical protein
MAPATQNLKAKGEKEVCFRTVKSSLDRGTGDAEGQGEDGAEGCFAITALLSYCFLNPFFD